MKRTLIERYNKTAICNRLLFGPFRKKINVSLTRDYLDEIEPPVFFLSTGRCGTTWFAKLLNTSPNCICKHEPEPNLAYQSKFAYEVQHGKPIEKTDPEFPFLKEILLAGRERIFRYVYKTNKTYVETNNRMTFFAPILSEIIPQAKFVHIYRHPAEFVRSGMRREYYSENDVISNTRITPHKNSNDYGTWPLLSEFEKVCWLWNETNTFIDLFLKEIPAKQIFRFNFNHLSQEKIISLLEFMDCTVKKNKIQKKLNKRSNAQLEGKFPKYKDWNEKQKIKLKEICGPLAESYGYEIFG